jgi:hypothetical protein
MKSYHMRRYDLRILYEDEDPTWSHYSYTDTKKIDEFCFVNGHLDIT